MQLSKTTPILRIFDEAKAREFYVAYLGFRIDWEHRFAPGMPLYLQISRGGCVLHLSEHHGDACPGAAMRIETDALDAFHQELEQKEYGYARPSIEAQPWGSRDMSLRDPFGNRLTFTDSVGG
ncbi:glyoxalase superfamily protein [Pseudomonas sp. F(2018)]|uniref:glyoxalase superfamily protein n=1 Tax=Pseudomonas sp. F(2018) TaxID=2502240 RepID=UPI0010F58C54|nr:glyoxalase superfamily protein [Pseudomonas sp. F(2018)]